ncbi:MAG: NAD(P)/FAD-dependent oxidoreductase [Myxococcales bacterium]|nr:NAD(P)/FAD-dependent oxidoreductase [Myxococcales bacterium]
MPQPGQPAIAVIIGAGPAGLTAAYELLDQTEIKPLVLEASGDLGGLSKTVEYHGNRIDIGGHRFFSKSDAVMRWWQNLLPLQGAPAVDDRLLGRNIPLAGSATQRPLGAAQAVTTPAPDPEQTDRVMLWRGRVSRILFLRKLFQYPVTLSPDTLLKMGLFRTFKVGMSYLASRLRPIRPEKSLEDFFINRFGQELYRTFFQSYTEKVWGVPCRRIGPDWGAQRVKGLSLFGAIGHALKRIFRRDRSLAQKHTETSLIDQFLYPKFGPGQMWEEVGRAVQGAGGEIRLHCQVVGLRLEQGKMVAARVRDRRTGAETDVPGDYFFSSMPLAELIGQMDGEVPPAVREVAAGLQYRDFLTVGVLLNRLLLKNDSATPTLNNLVPDNWMYIQDGDVVMGRLQIFNNWSPYLVKDPQTVWLGVEYFCNEGDSLWTRPDDEMAAQAVRELASLGIVDPADVLDRVVIRMPKAYPAYFGTWKRLAEIRRFTDAIPNLFLIGRNGMHKYNNQDHSMLTAMAAVECLRSGGTKDKIWDVNTEEEYHEEK